MPPFINSLREFLSSTPFMNQVFLIAFVVPVIYWLSPARWRTKVLFGISVLTLLLGNVSLEYIALLILLLSLTWTVVAPPQSNTTRTISSLHLFSGLSIISVLAVVLALNERLPPLPDSPVLLVRAGLALGVAGIVLYVLSERALWWAVGRRLVPLVVLAPLILIFTTNLPSILKRYGDVRTLLVLLIVVAVLCATLCVTWARYASETQRKQIATVGIVLLIVVFILFKWPVEGPGLAWFGFSYIAFRLLHVLLERRLNNPLPEASPEEWGTYALFFSAQAVGPIDRWPRFAAEEQAAKQFSWDDYATGWERILWGAIKKFFIADVLLRHLIPGEVSVIATPPLYAWVQIYAYAFYLYCDFSGFVDIAIGTARLLGYHLPENFDRPYTRGSLALFWQSWHITLSSWLRTYVFLPLSRSLLRTRLKRSTLLTVLIANVVTMSLIGLWHGFTWNFLAWGLWHAVGLFIHKGFSDRTRRMQLKWKNTPRAQIFHVFSVFLTFHYVVLGWVFFALPSIETSIAYFAVLVGFRL